MPPPRAFDPKQFVAVAVAEGIAVVTVVLRFVLSNGAIALERPAHLVWFAGTIVLAAAAVSHFVLRSSLLRLRREASPDAEDASRQIFALSVAIALGALALAAVGPAPFEALLGGGAG